MQVESGIQSKWARVPALDLSAVSVCPRETEKRWNSASAKTKTFKQEVKVGKDQLPIDPRDWSRSHVYLWLSNQAQLEGFEPNHIAEKFPMNGKALCLMSLDMFFQRVPVGGKMLYRDFRLRLARAMSIQHY